MDVGITVMDLDMRRRSGNLTNDIVIGGNGALKGY